MRIFFPKKEKVEKETKKKSKPKATVYDCEKCGLSKNAFEYFGDKKSKLVLLLDKPNTEEIKNKIPFLGESGDILRNVLIKNRIRIKECLTLYAIQCPYKKKQEIYAKCCRSRLKKSLEQAQPNFVIAFGEISINTLLQNTKKFSINQLRNRVIPLYEFNCLAYSTFSPSEVREYNEEWGKWKTAWDKKYTQEKDVMKAVGLWKEEFQKRRVVDKYLKQHDILKDVKINRIKTKKELLQVIDLIHKTKAFAFDYEATNAKPFDDFFEPLYLSFGFEKEGYGIYIPEFEDLKFLKKSVFDLLQDKDLIKYIQNDKFEELASRWWFNKDLRGDNIQIINNSFCTMISTHVYDEREGCTSQDFQNLVRFGMKPYGKSVEKYIKIEKKEKKKVRTNKIKTAPVDAIINYNVLDTITCWHNAQIIRNELLPSYEKYDYCYNLLHDGHVHFCDVEEEGVPVNVDKLIELEEMLEIKMEEELDAICKIKSLQEFFKTKTIDKIMLGTFLRSPKQVQEYIYKHLKIESVKKTKTGESTDEEVINILAGKGVELCNHLVRYRKLKKAKDTYIQGIMNNVNNDSKMHASINCNTVETYRSCIAKGTMIEVIRDVSKNPEGIPIENVKVGDLVYCYDDELNPRISVVDWAGKTGYRKVVRIHWKGSKNNYGHLDLTPEHLVRLINGDYIEAQKSTGDFRNEDQSKHSPKSRVLSLTRVGDELFFTGKISKNNRGIKEHRFIYEEINGKLKDDEIIHHIDNNHFNHLPINLRKMKLREHSSLHNIKLQNTKKAKWRQRNVAKNNWKNGKFKKVGLGFDNPNSLKLTKEECLTLLKECNGILSNAKGISIPTFSKYLKHYNIKWERKWNNQHTKEEIVNNHIIIDIEYIDKYTEVYDLEVRDFHNFIAGGICVHNSITDFAMQTLPKHGNIIDDIPWVVIRGCFEVADKKNFIFGQVDYSGFELFIGAAISGDPKLIHDVNKYDLHAREAIRVFDLKCSPEEVKKLDFPGIGKGKDIRFTTKNCCNFATIYGSVPPSIARSLRNEEVFINFGKLKYKESKSDIPFDEWFIYWSNEWVTNWQEKQFFGDYPGLKKFQDKQVQLFEKNGYVEYPLGFRRHHPLDRNKIINAPTQGTAFLILLDAFIKVNKQVREWRKERDFKTRIILETHDDMLFLIYKPEFYEFYEMVNSIVLHPEFEFTKNLKLQNEWSFGYNLSKMIDINE